MPLYYSGRPDIQATYYMGDNKTKIDLSPYITGLNISKDLSQPAGMWEMSLVTDFIRRGVLNPKDMTPFDYMELRLRSDPGLARPFYYTRGFVDNLTLATDGSPSGGKMARQITLNGRDYGGLLQNYQVHAVNASQIKQQLSYALLTDQLKYDRGADDINNFVYRVIHNILNDIHITGKNKDHTSIPGIKSLQGQVSEVLTRVNMPSKFGINLGQDNMLNFSGNLDELIRQVQSPPWGEYFIRDDWDKPRVYFRVPPFLYSDGTFANLWQTKEWGNITSPYDTEIELVWVELQPQDILSTNLTLSQNQVYTYFISTIQSGVIPGDVMGALLAEQLGVKHGNFNPYFAGEDTTNPKALNRAARFGFRPLEMQSALIPGSGSNTGFKALDDPKDPASLELMKQMNQWAVRAFGRNEELESGTIVCRGVMGTRRGHNEIAARVGDYVYFQKERGEQPYYYYIQSMDIAWTEGAPLTTTFQVVHGEQFEKGLKEHPYKLF